MQIAISVQMNSKLERSTNVQAAYLILSSESKRYIRKAVILKSGYWIIAMHFVRRQFLLNEKGANSESIQG